MACKFHGINLIEGYLRSENRTAKKLVQGDDPTLRAFFQLALQEQRGHEEWDAKRRAG